MKIVKARYTGSYQVVMPHLADPSLSRPSTDKAERAWAEQGQQGPNPRCVVNPGDVIPIDEYSAKGRSDFELFGTPRKRSTKKRTTKKQAASAAPEAKEGES